MDRRRFIQATGAGVAGLVAGCSAEPTDDGTATDPDGDGSDGTDAGTDSGTDAGTDTGTDGTVTGTTRAGTPLLRVATYPSFVDAPSTSPGAWVEEQFESEHDVDLEWFAPDNEMRYFLQRRNQGVSIDTDMYLGMTPENLVRVDSGVEDGDSLFTGVDTSRLENVGNVVDDYRFDPQERAIPFGASYISLVYNQNLLDERGVGAPETYDDLVSPDYEDGLILSNPQSSETGLEFLFMTINEFGEDGYLDYWRDLMDNGTEILEGWGAAYGAYSENEAPMVVSYSTDQVFADQSGDDMARHQIGFPNGQGYAYLEAMAPFAGTEKMDLAVEFMDFVLQPDVQAEIAQRNVALPAVDNAELPADYDDLVHEPETIVSYSYDELAENMDTWLNDWAQQIASN